MSNEKYKYNLNMSMNNNKNDGYSEAAKNAGEGRKILQAKRHGSSRLNRHITQPTTSQHTNTSHGVKRTQCFDNADQPPVKKSYLDYTPQRMSYAPVHNSAKNLALRRMENLRKSLEQQKKDELKKMPVLNTKCSPNITPKMSVSNINERLMSSSSRDSFTPNYKSDGHFKRSRRHDSDDDSSPCSSPVKNSSVQKRLESYKSSDHHDVRSNLSSKFISSSSSPLSVCSSTSYSDMVKRNKESSTAFNNNSQLSSSPVKSCSQTSDGSSSMEWSAIDEETILENIHELRKEINYNRLPINNITEQCDMLTATSHNDSVYIVVDTNIFLSHLSFVSRLRDTNFTGFGRAVIVVPWMVIQELDYMKESNHHRSLRKGAQKAVHYINDQLVNKHPQFKGQTVLEASAQDLSSINPDDGILFCCMQLAQQKKTVILLSNDVNLRSKALVNNLQAYNNNDIINNLNNMNTVVQHTDNDTRSVQKIKILLSNLLTYIIEKEMKDAFGDLWLRMAMIQPPFTTEEALICLDKYWISVFSFSLQKQCKQKIEEFIVFMKNHRHGDNYATADFIKFVEYTLSLCIYLKNGYRNYREKVSECILNIQKCAE